jgi:protein-glutamine gamma-glutamyltransferase
MNTRPAFSTTLTTVFLVAIATLPLREVFGDWSWTVGVIGAAAAGALVATIGETLRRDLPIAAVAASIALGAGLWVLLVPLNDVLFGDPTSSTIWQELVQGVFNGWGALLEERFPLTDPRSAEAFAAVLAWVATASAVHVAARRGSALAAVFAGAVVLWVSTAAALPRGLTPAVLGAGAGAMALFVISTVTRPPDQRWRLGRALALTTVIVLAAAAATLAGSIASSFDRRPFDPRSSRSTEVVGVEVPDILAEFGVRRGQDQTVMSLDGTGFPSSLRLRLQVYETHDGERWLPTADFEEVATFPESEVLPPGEIVDLVVTLDDIDGPWVPLPDRLIRTDLADLQWSEDTQTALSPGLVRRYEVTGTTVSRAGLEGLDAARDEVPQRLSEIPAGLPASIRSVAEDVTAETTDALSAIDAITARLRTMSRDDTAAPGNSFGRLRDDLADNRATGAEQIASLHALMLRAIGIPSRLVVGYIATSPLVESADLHIWTEAAFPGVGWIPFDPVPTLTEGGPELRDDPSATTTTLPTDAALQARALPRELAPDEDPGQAPIDAGRGLTFRDATFLAVGALILLFGMLIATRLVRRRIRRSSGWRAEVRVLGAWAEVVDRLRELGAPVASTTTINDIVYMATAIDPELGENVRVIADLTAIALHAPDGSVPDEATQAWRQVSTVESRIGLLRGRHAVPLRHLDPRVLRHRAPRPPPSRDGGHRGPPTEVSPQP